MAADRSSPPPAPITFTYRGARYQLPAGACPCWLIRLPDGQLLQVGGWLESLPPHPTDLTPSSEELLVNGGVAHQVANAELVGPVPAAQQPAAASQPAVQADLPPLHVDWTVDPATSRTNSSTSFVRLLQVVAELLRRSLPSALFADDGPETVARVVMAQLAHVHHLAPADTVVQSATETSPGNLSGHFTWNGQVFRYSAVHVADDGRTTT